MVRPSASRWCVLGSVAAGGTRMTDDILETGPPTDEFAERAFLASLILDPRLADAALPMLTASDFWNIRNRTIFVAMLDLHEAGKPTDTTLVVGQLRDNGQLGDGGDDQPTIACLTDLFELLPTAVHVGYYARRIREVAERRHAHY